MSKNPIKTSDSIGPGTILGSDDLPYQSLIPGNPNFSGGADAEPALLPEDSFASEDPARRFGRELADLNPPLTPRKFR